MGATPCHTARSSIASIVIRVLGLDVITLLGAAMNHFSRNARLRHDHAAAVYGSVGVGHDHTALSSVTSPWIFCVDTRGVGDQVVPIQLEAVLVVDDDALARL